MKNKKKKKNHRDKNGREFIKESYFVGGKMKFRRIFVIDGISAEEFYEKNATNLDLYLNGDYELMNSENDSDNRYDAQSKNETDFENNKDTHDLLF
ncbi:MAG: hypothetical protein K9H48_16380 [Melioribacteraceae bacterium]|nr:hypothetical protein [Melioribacteraceae bacterium]MCF8394407.1 hypothetical protein [Melioribacteraceae bacterium]MCF8417497.1 hypothetical protein [Melioribacteraceae bacterium]